MSMPGWYPDPAGAPNQYRYWDGRRWSSNTSPHPNGAPGQSEDDGGGPGPAIWIIAAVVIIAVIVAAILIFRPGGSGGAKEDNNSSTPTVSAWDETSTPTPTNPSPSNPNPSNGEWTACPTGAELPNSWGGGDLRGGNLAVTPVPNWSDSRSAGSSSFWLGWMHDMEAQTDVVAVSGTTTWFSTVAVGAVSVADGFDAPRSAAQMAMDCFATSQYYSGFVGRKDISSQEVSIDGSPGWWIRAEVYVRMPDMPQIPGDVIDVVAVDTGNPESLSMFMSSYTIGDTQRQGLVDAARQSIRVVR